METKLSEYGITKRFVPDAYFGNSSYGKETFRGHFYETETWVISTCRVVDDGIEYDLLDTDKVENTNDAAKFTEVRMAKDWDEVETEILKLIVLMRMKNIFEPVPQ